MAQTKTICLEYLEEFDSYGIAVETIRKLTAEGFVADIRFHGEAYGKTPEGRPLVGFLLGQDKGKNGAEYYTVGGTYAYSIINSGAEIKFLDYDSVETQMKSCHGLILPGGAFDNPEEFYIDGKNTGIKEGKRFLAYKSAIKQAYGLQKPMLGICAGAQMIGSILGNMKMYRSLADEVPLHTGHKPLQEHGVRLHQIKLKPATPLYDIMGLSLEVDKILINSRHSQAMVHQARQDSVEGEPLVKMEMYAVSDVDGVPEIWGNETAGILCIQGHPEDLAAKGDEAMLRIYRHIADLAAKYKREHPKEDR